MGSREVLRHLVGHWPCFWMDSPIRRLKSHPFDCGSRRMARGYTSISFPMENGHFLQSLQTLVRRLSLANPELADPLQGAGVVLIDEIELHLHPTWQRSVIEKLRTTFPNIQFIATTHSPFVIQSLRAGELINLNPEEFGEYVDKSIEDIAENVMGVEMPQKSERYLQMMEAAEAYFRLLRSPDPITANVNAAEQRLNELAAPFSDDPAFQALLKLERETQGREGGDAAG